jgi:hypothetical protein
MAGLIFAPGLSAWTVNVTRPAFALRGARNETPDTTHSKESAEDGGRKMENGKALKFLINKPGNFMNCFKNRFPEFGRQRHFAQKYRQIWAGHRDIRFQPGACGPGFVAHFPGIGNATRNEAENYGEKCVFIGKF